MARDKDLQRWARLRFAVVGPLLAAPPPAGELQQALRELSQRHWLHPNTGLPVRFGLSTIERWYYKAKSTHDPITSLGRQRRDDAGRARVFPAPVVAQIHALYRANPQWSVQLLYDNLCACRDLEPELGKLPSYSSLKRYVRANGLIKQRKPRMDTPGARQAAARIEHLEIRSYEAEYVHGLWHLDFHHGSRRVLEPDGRWIKPMLLGVIDDHSRLGCHLQWYRSEDTQALVHGFCQALAKRGLPRACLSDNGSAMISEEFTAGLQTLGIVHERTLSHSPYHYVLKSFMCYSPLNCQLTTLLVERIAHKLLHQRLPRKAISVFCSLHGITDPCFSATEHAASARALVSRSISA